MRRSLILSLAGLAAVLFLFGQRAQNRAYEPFEVRAVFPRENPPGFYQQVEPRELQILAEEGWELVSVMPYVYRNEERGSTTPKAVVTQTYPAYFFKRAKAAR
jgi:hypothetical protein